MKIVLQRMPGGWANASDEAEDLHRNTKIGHLIHADFKRIRNPLFHRKFFALLRLAFDAWEPGEITSRYGVPEKNFDRFRKDLIILSGRYHVVVRLDGSTVIEPESISFANMSQDEFEKVYSSVIDVIISKIPALGDSREEIDSIVNKILDFV